MIKRFLKWIKWSLIASIKTFRCTHVEVPQDITPKQVSTSYPLFEWGWGIKAEDVRKRIEELKNDSS